MADAERDEGQPLRRWVEGVVTAKVLDRRTVVLRSAEFHGNEFAVPDPDLWKQIEIGTIGIAETDHGRLLTWRSLTPPQN